MDKRPTCLDKMGWEQVEQHGKVGGGVDGFDKSRVVKRFQFLICTTILFHKWPLNTSLRKTLLTTLYSAKGKCECLGQNS